MTAPHEALVARADTDSSTSFTPAMHALLIALLILAILAVSLGGGLYLLRQVRNKRRAASELPVYERGYSRATKYRGLTIATDACSRESVLVYQEKQNLVASSQSPPPSPVPEIRITFPEEVDEQGKRQSGRVVVVRVGEHSVGLEPVNEDLPPYQKSDYDRFHSLDLDRIGGLKEKEAR